MPPPKKPKVGRTSLEQFLSEEERGGNSVSTRISRDSEGNSPAGSLEDGSDGEVFVPVKDSDKASTDDNTPPEKTTEDRSHIFHKLLMKSHSVDEQKVPGSPEQEILSPTLSPPVENGEKMGAFRKYQDHIRLQLEKRRQLEVKLECVSPKQSEGDEHFNKDIEGRRESFESSTAPKQRLSTEQGRLIDTLVASALASSAAQSIIYGGKGPSQDSRSSISTFQHGQNLSFSTCTMKNYDSEPHDLSKKSESGKHFGHRLYENLSNTSDQGRLASAYREWAALRQTKEIAIERSKQYLESHRRIVGLLSERTDDGCRDNNHITEKENIVQAVPARYPNGLFNPVSMNGMLGNYQRFEAHAR